MFLDLLLFFDHLSNFFFPVFSFLLFFSFFFVVVWCYYSAAPVSFIRKQLFFMQRAHINILNSIVRLNGCYVIAGSIDCLFYLPFHLKTQKHQFSEMTSKICNVLHLCFGELNSLVFLLLLLLFWLILQNHHLLLLLLFHLRRFSFRRVKAMSVRLSHLKLNYNISKIKRNR